MKHELLEQSDLDVLPNGNKPEMGAVKRRFAEIEDWPQLRDVASTGIVWAVEGLVPRGNVVMLTGESGCGKSTFMLALAHSVSTGQPFLGRPTMQMPVLILDRENPGDTVLERFRRLQIDEHDNFRILGQWAGEDPPDGDAASVLGYVARCGVKPMVVIDSLIRFHDCEENSSTEMRKAMNTYRSLASLGVTVILLHHSGKGENAQEYRGSSDIKAACDIAYKMTAKEERLALSELKAFKERIGVTPKLMLRYADVRGFSALEEQPFVPIEDRLTELLRNNPCVTKTEFVKLAAAGKISRDRARAFLESGLENATVVAATKAEGGGFTWVGSRRDK